MPPMPHLGVESAVTLLAERQAAIDPRRLLDTQWTPRDLLEAAVP